MRSISRRCAGLCPQKPDVKSYPCFGAAGLLKLAGMKQHLGICYDQTSDFQQEQFNVLMALVHEAIPDRDLAAVRSMIDIGAGTGARTLQSFRVFQSVQRMTAIEPDRDMMTVAREKYADRRVTYIQSTAEDMDKAKIEGAPLGAVMSNWALHWVPDKKKLMQDINALTQCGSYFVFSTCERLPALLQMVDAYVRSEFRIDGAQSPFYYLNLDEWRALLAANGWRIAGVKSYTVGHEVPDTQEYLKHWFTASTAKFLYGRHLVELSSWAHSDLIWMMNRAFPSEKNPEGMLFTEDVMFVIAQRE